MSLRCTAKSAPETSNQGNAKTRAIGRITHSAHRLPAAASSRIVVYVDELEQRGYAGRWRNPHGRRQHSLSHDGGKKLMRRISELLANMSAASLPGWIPGDAALCAVFPQRLRSSRA
jgi:phenylpyruvate tautomerase PptA (4-oxalocrotonate tautomerase family)